MRARDSAERALNAGCTALLSFGVAGGLASALPSGTLVLAETVIGPDGKAFPMDQSWRSAMARDLDETQIKFVSGHVSGSDAPVSSPADKQSHFDRTQALCVDMESHAMVQVATARNIPCLVVRAIADSAEDVLPDIAIAAINSEGDVRYGALIKRLAARPSDLADLMRLWRLSRPAFASLSRVASLPSLGGPL